MYAIRSYYASAQACRFIGAAERGCFACTWPADAKISKRCVRAVLIGLMANTNLTITIALLITSLILVGCEREQAPKSAREAMHLPQPGYVADAKRGQGLFQVKCSYNFV